MDTEDFYFPHNDTHRPRLPLQYYIENEQWELIRPVQILEANLTFHGEKISFTVTILLTEIVSISSIVDVVPASSNNVPLIIYFIATVTLHLSCTCIVAATVVNIYYNSSFVTMYGFLQRAVSSPYVFLLFLKPCPVPPKTSSERKGEASMKGTHRDTSPNISSVIGSRDTTRTVINNFKSSPNNAVSRLTSPDNSDPIMVDDSDAMLQWKYLATMVDRIFFFVHLSVMTTLLLTFRILYKN
ncbi:uncharacterized protein LOC142349121 [Convolutriloba macropyga]|uniref:uncharacterized protein LOC142349121 n=1 Tax=Convolutriloba macropyga TaxID=536237 RepID=UPI003F51CA4B